MSKSFERAVQGLKSRIYLLIGRAVLHAVADAGKRQFIQLTALKGEVKDQVERIQDYGFTSFPLPGAQVIMACVSGNRDHPIALRVDDPRYRKNDLEGGEVSLYNHEGTFILLKNGNEILIKADTKIRIETPRLEVTGDIVDHVDEGGESMEEMRDIYNMHTHPEDASGNTEIPNQQMADTV